MLINAIMLNVNALEMERGKNQSQIFTQLGEGFANHTTQVNSLLNISHTYKEFLGLSRVFFFASNLGHTLFCWLQPSCHRLQTLCPLPAATMAWSLHPSIPCSLQASACTQLLLPFPLPWPLQPLYIWKPSSLEEFVIFISDFPILH